MDPSGRPSLGPVSPGRTPSSRGSRRCRWVSSTWAKGAGFSADTGLRGRTSKRGMGCVNAWPLNSGLRGQPVGTAPYALGANGLRPFLKASAPPAVKSPILIRSRRETCPCDHAFRISARFLRAFSASLTRALDALHGRYIRVSPCRSNWALLLVDEPLDGVPCWEVTNISPRTIGHCRAALPGVGSFTADAVRPSAAALMHPRLLFRGRRMARPLPMYCHRAKELNQGLTCSRCITAALIVVDLHNLCSS